MCEIPCLEAAPIINIEITHNLAALKENFDVHTLAIELCVYLHLPTILQE